MRFFVFIIIILAPWRARAQFVFEKHPEDPARQLRQKYNHIVYYEDSVHVKILGNYIPGTYIKDGAWYYFYRNGIKSQDLFFSKDENTGTWVYYDTLGHVTRKVNFSQEHKLDPWDILAFPVFLLKIFLEFENPHPLRRPVQQTDTIPTYRPH
ncbi:MAG: hypothetical protein JST26_03375 [Bacteroidetes bacterium]|nr:hypothetical protein [Bacteroidota bacterium]